MEIKNFTITKRDGTKDRFSLDKIMNAILKAFESVNEPIDLGSISKIISHLDMQEDIKVEDIQNQVEEALMREGYYQVAKSFMLYRQQHTEDRETLEKLKFLSDYVDAANAATGSLTATISCMPDGCRSTCPKRTSDSSTYSTSTRRVTPRSYRLSRRKLYTTVGFSRAASSKR